jgi:hypothetical protein
MKKLLTIILFFLTYNSIYGQTTSVLENFDSTSNWNFTNGAGIQEYPNNNYASFNINDESYLNDTLIIIESPIYELECQSPLLVEFALFGNIEDSDTLFFQYFDNNEWLTKDWFSGIKDITPSYNFSPFITQFRFVLKTDTSKLDSAEINGVMVEYDASNSYVGRVDTRREILVYFYDIDFFKIECVETLPIELAFFNGTPYAEYNELEWVTFSETNNDKFIIQRSQNAVDFIDIGILNGKGTTSVTNFYIFLDKTPPLVSYYRLKQKDFNGDTQNSDIIVVIRDNGMQKLVKILNIMGQEVDETYQGIKIYLYDDGSIVKKYHQNLN